MDWVVDFVSDVDKENVKLIRETLEAKVKSEAGEYGDAARILWELLIQVRYAKNKTWECMTMVHMGKVYRALRWSIAVQLFEQALELADEIGLVRAKMMALVELGELRCHWGQFDESLVLFNEAMSLVEPGDLESRRIILLNIVIAHEGLDELQTCARMLDEVLDIDRQIDCDDMAEDIAHRDRIQRAIKEMK
jgi:tetratricopeptide (TPR) repeat protein